MTLSFIATIIIAVIFTVIGIYLIGRQIREKIYIDSKKSWYLIVFFDILYFFEIFLVLMNAYINLR
mgnify:CR=1 FL=1